MHPRLVSLNMIEQSVLEIIDIVEQQDKAWSFRNIFFAFVFLDMNIYIIYYLSKDVIFTL